MLEGDRQAQGSPWECGVRQEVDQWEGTWVPGREEGHVLPAWLTARFPHLFLLPLCVPILSGSISKLQNLLSDSVPLIHVQVPPGLLGPALQNPVPRALPQAKGGQRRSPCTTHQRRGSAWGWATQVTVSSLSAVAPAFPKQQVPPGWGPTLKAGVSFTKT